MNFGDSLHTTKGETIRVYYLKDTVLQWKPTQLLDTPSSTANTCDKMDRSKSPEHTVYLHRLLYIEPPKLRTPCYTELYTLIGLSLAGLEGLHNNVQ